MKVLLNIKRFYLIIFLLCVISLISAVYIEYILEQTPCKLCIYQRVPYLFGIFVCFFGYNYFKNFFWLYTLLTIFMLSSILSGYHMGIENNIFNEFSGCTNANLNITNKSDLLDSLKKSVMGCKNVNFSIFGLSLATINFIVSLMISIISYLMLKYEKNK
tara:strand:+ start:625 stop:1104 length:480 start_codon:yes stop_codon:yes gene_type:complete